MRTRSLTIVAALLAAGTMTSTAFAEPRCDPKQTANGPFAYAPAELGAKTFLGTGGAPATFTMTVTAPGQSGDSWFPAASNGPCSDVAPADIAVMDIEKIADESGNLLDTPVDIDVNSPLGLQIAAAVTITPSAHIFTIAEALAVNVTVGNPGVAPADYGDYLIVIKAHAPATGVGVGSGSRVQLNLRAPAVGDTVPPDVTVTQPSANQVLGPIHVEIAAADPTPGTGVNSMNASIRSAGGVVANQPIVLVLDQALPVAAGVTVTGAGTFYPVGGTGVAGTSDAAAFTASSRSGIGNYVITATATDVAGNVGTGSGSFAVAYDVAFTKASAPPPCATAQNQASCTSQFQFTVKRSSITSDGAFMFDRTVKVELVSTQNNQIVATHVYGAGDVKTVVQLDAVNLAYVTHFRRGDIGATGPRTYVARVYFLDVDNGWMLQATSSAVTF